MKAMYLAFAVTIVLAVLASIALDRAGFSTKEVTSGPAVRLD